MESYKKRLEERKKIRGILNNCGLRQDWLKNKSGKTELESRVLKRMQLKGRPEITIKEVSSKASVWRTFWNFLLSVLVNTLDFSSRLGLIRLAVGFLIHWQFSSPHGWLPLWGGENSSGSIRHQWPRGRELSTKFNTGRKSLPQGPTPYPFIYHFLRKRYPFHILSVYKSYSFHIPVV